MLSLWVNFSLGRQIVLHEIQASEFVFDFDYTQEILSLHT